MHAKKSYKNILVGGSGFIGSQLSLELVRRGESVLSIARSGHGESVSGVDRLILDVADEKALQDYFPLGERVYILIGQNHAEFNVEKELQTLKKLIDILNERHPKEVLYLSSALVYGETEIPADESTLPHPGDLYSQFKYSAEALLHQTLHSDIRLGILRLANVYGGKKNRGFIGLIMDRLARAESEPLIVNGDGLQERDYIFVDDVAKAILAVADGLKKNDIVNIATGKSHTLLDIVDEISHITGQPFPYEKNNKTLVEVGRSRISNQKLRGVYGFRPQVSLREGLRETLRRSVDSSGVISGKRMLFLGGEGFIGRNLANYFGENNQCYSVGRRPSLFSERPDNFIQANPYQTKLEGKYDVIVHLIDNKIPLERFEREEEKLLTHISLNKNGHLIVFSSAVIYANPDSEYGQRKRRLEALCTRYAQEHGIQLTILRPFNLFGPYQLPYRPGSLIANLLYNVLTRKVTEINDMETRRDFTYVGNLGKFVEHVLKEKKTGIFDVGSGKLVQVRDLLAHLEEVVFGQKIDFIDKAVREGIPDQPADEALSAHIHMVDFDAGLRRTLLFYQDNLHLLRDYVERKDQ